MLSLPRSDWTLVHALRIRSVEQGDKVYCTFEVGTSLTYAQLDQESKKLAEGLVRNGVCAGDRVMVIAKSRPEYLIAFYAAQKCRAIFVPVNTELKGELLRHQIANSGPKVLMSDTNPFDEASALALKDVRLFVTIDSDISAPAAARTIAFSDLCRAAEPLELPAPSPSDACLIIYTSGTSGPSKGVIVTQCHAYLFGLQQALAMQVSEEDKYYVCLPMFHVNALLMALGSSLLSGASAHVAERFSASGWISDIAASGATLTNMLGAMAEFIMVQPLGALDSKHKLKRVMAVPASSSWGQVFCERFSVSLVQVYGMTECNIVAFTGPNDAFVAGRVGRVSHEFFEVALLDSESQEAVPAGSVGEICIRPRLAFGFMDGYFNMPEVTLRSWRGLWFHTGDAGRFDTDGYLYFVDRLGDCIRRRGENISSFEIEQVLLTNPKILECAIVGIKIDGAGGEEEIKACLVPAADKFDLTEFSYWCADHLPRYAVPRFIELFKSLAKTATGKIQKLPLRAIGVTEATWDREKAGIRFLRGSQ
jgi:crotonobetaine/carnitine-CoA ligase